MSDNDVNSEAEQREILMKQAVDRAVHAAQVSLFLDSETLTRAELLLAEMQMIQRLLDSVLMDRQTIVVQQWMRLRRKPVGADAT